ncbi:apolipoprotein N-acyltransferase [Pseudonocardia sp. D17]|nr:apolipoprotein N-acyltransferase [Pseudonocardia sp. D17]
MLPLGAAALTAAIRHRGFRARLALGALTGVTFYASTLSWLIDFTTIGYGAVALLQSGMLAAAAAVVPAAENGRWAGGWWTTPFALVAVEAVQARFPFGGFPLSSLSLSQPDGPFAPVAAFGGSLLVTAVAAAAGGGTGRGLVHPTCPGPRRRRRSRDRRSIRRVLGSATAARTEEAGTAEIVAVQGGGPRGLRAIFTNPDDTTDRQFEAAEGIDGSPDLVLLPENVITVDGPIAGTAEDLRLAELARRLSTSVVVGVVERYGDGFRNAAVLWDPTGTISGRYEKEHRVPFGEYIPARGVLAKLTDLTRLVPRDAIPGSGLARLDSLPTPLAVAISYEVLFADRVREGVSAGGQVVLVPTNAASYVSADVPAIELAAARLRAIEFGRAVIQAAPTGYSAVVDLDGKVRVRSELGEPALLREVVSLRNGQTIYANVGDTPMIALAGVLILIAPALQLARTRRTRSQSSGSGSDAR